MKDVPGYPGEMALLPATKDSDVLAAGTRDHLYSFVKHSVIMLHLHNGKILGCSLGGPGGTVHMDATIFWLTWVLGVGLFLLCLFAKLYIPSANTQLPPVSNLALPLVIFVIVGMIRLRHSAFRDRLRGLSLSRILYPELDLFENPEERDTILQTAIRAHRRHPKFWLASIIPFAVAYLAAKLLMATLSRYNVNRMLGFVFVLLFIVVFGRAMHYAINRTFRDPVRRAMRGELAKKGVAICVECGYDLRGQREPRCPECGNPFDERLLAGRSIDR